MLIPPRFPHQYQGVVLRFGQPTSLNYVYGTITLYGGPFQATSTSSDGGRFGRTSTPHPRGVCQPQGFGLSSSPFPRRYSGNPVMVSFPPPTWMFPFGGFPLPLVKRWKRYELFAHSRRSYSGIPGSKAACASPGLIAACHALPRRPSRAIH